MSNQTNREGKLNDSLMLRVRACAIINHDTRKEKIEAIAHNQNVQIDTAAMIYTLGALKKSIKQGKAKNYSEAIELMEREQVGDRQNPLTRTVSQIKMSSNVQRINRQNQGEKITLDGVSYINDYDLVSTIGGERVVTPHWSVSDKTARVSNGRRIGKALGDLYAEYQECITNTDVLIGMFNKGMQKQYLQLEDNLRRYFADYTARLSKTATARVLELQENEQTADYLMTKALTDKADQSHSLAKATYNLYTNFPHKESITHKEFIDLTRKYANIPQDNNKPYKFDHLTQAQ